MSSPWTRTSPHRWEKPFDVLDTLFTAFATVGAHELKENMSITLFSKFETSMNHAQLCSSLRGAWTTIRFDHPEIAAFLDGQSVVYETPSSAELEQWLDQTVVIHPPETTRQDAFNDFRMSKYASLHYLPGPSELLLHIAHWRIDAIGGMALFSNLFKAMCNPPSRPLHFGNEGNRLSFNTLDLTPESSPQSRAYSHAMLEDIASHGLSAGLPLTQENPASYGNARYDRVQFDTATTAALVAACKSRGITVTTAVHAAMIEAIKSVNSDSKAQFYNSFGIFQLRKYLPAPYDDPALHPVNECAAVKPLIVPVGHDFDANTTYLQRVYKEDLGKTPYMPALKDFIAGFLEMAAAQQQGDGHIPCEPMLTSLGVLNNYVDEEYSGADGRIIRVREMGDCVEILGAQTCFSLFTWSGKLEISVCWNDGFIEEDVLATYVSEVQNTLFKELHVQPTALTH